MLAVCCGLAACARAPPSAFHSLSAAFASLRAAPPRDSSSAVIVELYGTCYESLRLSSVDSHVTVRAAPPSARAGISAAVPLFATDFSPVTDVGILAQLPPVSRSAVLQVDLAALGVPLAPLTCQPYVGGNSVMTPGLLQPAGAELFVYGDPRGGGDAGPLTLARFPNADAGGPKAAWASLFDVHNGTLANLGMDATAASRSPLWAQQLREDPGSLRTKYIGSLGWLEHTQSLVAVSALSPPPNTTRATVSVELGANCGTLAEDVYGDGGVVLLTNVLAELDEPGEYTINRTAGMAYVWFPATPSEWPTVAPWGSPYVADGVARGAAAASPPLSAGVGAAPLAVPLAVAYVSAAPHAVELDGASFVTFEGLVFEGSQDAAVVVRNSTRVTFSGCLVQNAGNMAVNVTHGGGVALQNCTIRGGANGAALLEGGDRITLQPGGHSITNSTLSYSSRLVWLNAPMVSVDGVGHAVEDSEIYGGPHMGVYHSGNDHRIARNLVREVVQACSDCGAIYGGRDWAYQGTAITGNTLMNLHSNEGPDVSAVYLDDMISGVAVVDNLFVNVSRALLLGGGRWNIFARNTIRGVSLANDAAVHFDNRGMNWDNPNDAAVHFDNRGMNWDNPSCNLNNPAPNMVVLLERVPYNTSQVWLAAFPALADILKDEPCIPKYNMVENNTFCLLGHVPFLDVSSAQVTSWGSTVANNVNATTC